MLISKNPKLESKNTDEILKRLVSDDLNQYPASRIESSNGISITIEFSALSYDS